MISLTLVVAVSFVSPVQVHAQSAGSTGGGWGEFALGYGSLHAFSGTSGGGRHMDGYSFVFGAGITGSHVYAGALLDIWRHRFPDGKSADTTYFKGFGFTGTLGIGRDLQIGWLVFSPRLAYLYGAPRTLHSPNGTIVATGSMQHMLEASIAFVAH